MKFKVILIFVTAILLSASILLSTASAIPLMLNNVPTTDITAHKNMVLMLNYYGYNYKTPQTVPTNSFLYSMEYGYNKCELGFDYTMKKSFTDAGGYPGPMAWNFKWKIMSEGSDPVSLAVGAFYAGAKSYNNQYYGASPYFVFSKQLKDVRLHLGYQTNLLGVKETDTDNKKSRGVIVGLDGVIIKSEKNPVTLMLDYTGGPLATYGIGIFQPINSKWSWSYSFYKPVKNELPISKTEVAKQHWIGINYTMQIK